MLNLLIPMHINEYDQIPVNGCTFYQVIKKLIKRSLISVFMEYAK